MAAKSELLDVYDSLLRATTSQDEAPVELLAAAASRVASADAAVVETLPVRARVVIRLLRIGAVAAAWPVLVDSASGVVDRTFHSTTSSGADRADWRLPLLTSVEPPAIFAELPGFRDPRYAVPDDAYEIGAAVALRAHVDEVVPGRRPMLAGWAALDLLSTHPAETIAIIARHEGVEVSWRGSRHRRADLTGGSRETLRRRAWAGWRVELDPADLSSVGRWTLWLEVGHQGVTRRVRLGKSAGELATRAVGSQLTTKPHVDLVQGNGGWSVLVAAQRRR